MVPNRVVIMVSVMIIPSGMVRSRCGYFLLRDRHVTTMIKVYPSSMVIRDISSRHRVVHEGRQYQYRSWAISSDSF